MIQNTLTFACACCFFLALAMVGTNAFATPHIQIVPYGAVPSVGLGNPCAGACVEVSGFCGNDCSNPTNKLGSVGCPTCGGTPDICDIIATSE